MKKNAGSFPVGCDLKSEKKEVGKMARCKYCDPLGFKDWDQKVSDTCWVCYELKTGNCYFCLGKGRARYTACDLSRYDDDCHSCHGTGKSTVCSEKEFPGILEKYKQKWAEIKLRYF